MTSEQGRTISHNTWRREGTRAGVQRRHSGSEEIGFNEKSRAAAVEYAPINLVIRRDGRGGKAASSLAWTASHIYLSSMSSLPGLVQNSLRREKSWNIPGYLGLV